MVQMIQASFVIIVVLYLFFISLFCVHIMKIQIYKCTTLVVMLHRIYKVTSDSSFRIYVVEQKKGLTHCWADTQHFSLYWYLCFLCPIGDLNK